MFPPTAYLSLVMEKLKDTDVQLGVQDVHFEGGGAYTGALSVGMVKSLGATYVLCGHSERRSLFGDDDAAINRKARSQTALAERIVRPTRLRLCVRFPQCIVAD